MKRTFKIVGNWELNKGIQESLSLAAEVTELTKGYQSVAIGIAPVSLSLHALAQKHSGTHIHIGGQNTYFEKSGAFTGECSPTLLKDAGATFCIVGHSERRQIFKESNEDIGKKAALCLEAGLDLIVCCGETEAERETNKTNAIVESQLKAALMNCPKGLAKNITIAYEPVWAIGTGKSATPELAQEAHGFIRGLLETHFPGNSEHMVIQYGGSVKPGNAESLLKMPDIDGALVGGASLKPEDFAQICNIANNLSN